MTDERDFLGCDALSGGNLKANCDEECELRFFNEALKFAVGGLKSFMDSIQKPDDSRAMLKAIFISGGHDYWGRQGEGRLCSGITSVAEVECVAGKGLMGDRYFGYRENFKGQVTFFQDEVFQEIRQEFKLAKLPGSVFRRNLLVSGLDLAALKGREFDFQGLRFEGAQECKPCDWMNRAVAPGTEDFMKKGFRGGLRAKILTSGILRVERSWFSLRKMKEI